VHLRLQAARRTVWYSTWCGWRSAAARHSAIICGQGSYSSLEPVCMAHASSFPHLLIALCWPGRAGSGAHRTLSPATSNASKKRNFKGGPSACLAVEARCRGSWAPSSEVKRQNGALAIVQDARIAHSARLTCRGLDGESSLPRAAPSDAPAIWVGAPAPRSLPADTARALHVVVDGVRPLPYCCGEEPRGAPLTR